MIRELFVGLLVTLIIELGRITAALTPFADGWSPGLATTVRVALGAALVVGAVLLMIVGFSTVTLALGSPLYDKIAEEAEDALCDPPVEVPEPVAGMVGRTVAQTIGLILVSILGSLVAVLVGLVPVVGSVVGAVFSAVFGGYLLAIELVGSALERRGLRTISDRRALLRVSRARTLGFGVPVFLLMAVPLLAIVVFPAATAGGAVLARDLLSRRSAR